MTLLQKLLSPMWLANLYTLYGGGDAPAPQSSTTTVQNQYSPEDAAARAKVSAAAENIYNQQQQSGVWSGIVNPNAKPVGPSDNTLQAQQMVKNAATGPGQEMANNAGKALNFGLSGAALDPNSNPGFKGALDTAINRVSQTYQDPTGVLAQIRGGFQSNNSDGTGTREGIATGIAGRNYLQTVGDVTSNMTSNAYDKGIDLMKSSMAFAPNMYNLTMQPGATVGAVGNQQEAYQQAMNNYNAAGTNWTATAPWAGLSPYASMVTGMANPSTVTTGTATPPANSGSTGMGMLGGAMMGAQLGSMIPGVGTGIGAGAGAVLSMFT